MTILEAAIRPISAAAKPRLVMLENGNWPPPRQSRQNPRIGQVMELDNIRFKLLRSL
jgi:hypothetical protein